MIDDGANGRPPNTYEADRNGADTGGRLTGRESEPTSDGSFTARESEGPPAGEKQMAGVARHMVRSPLPKGTTVGPGEYRGGRGGNSAPNRVTP